LTTSSFVVSAELLPRSPGGVEMCCSLETGSGAPSAARQQYENYHSTGNGCFYQTVIQQTIEATAVS